MFGFDDAISGGMAVGGIAMQLIGASKAKGVASGIADDYQKIAQSQLEELKAKQRLFEFQHMNTVNQYARMGIGAQANIEARARGGTMGGPGSSAEGGARAQAGVETARNLETEGQNYMFGQNMFAQAYFQSQQEMDIAQKKKQLQGDMNLMQLGQMFTGGAGGPFAKLAGAPFQAGGPLAGLFGGGMPS